jgi:hypothetical protein
MARPKIGPDRDQPWRTSSSLEGRIYTFKDKQENRDVNGAKPVFFSTGWVTTHQVAMRQDID